MSYITHYLGKSPEEANLDDVQRLVAKVPEETQTLEYKTGRTDLTECGETISAFLNTDGGLLIIGAPETVTERLPEGRRKRACRGPFCFVKPLPDKDDAHRKLLARILPLPVGVSLRILPADLDGGVILVDVQKSYYPPHQYDNAYFVRLDAETRKAPHAFVEALFLRREGPNLECRAEIEGWKPDYSPRRRDAWDNRIETILRFDVVNNSRNIAEFFAFDLQIDGIQIESAALLPVDQQPEDVVLPVVEVGTRGRLHRYRLKGWVLHAYSNKILSYHLWNRVSKSHIADIRVSLQAKHMVRRSYHYQIDVREGVSPGELKSVVDTIDEP